jgi:hypothetical protein
MRSSYDFSKAKRNPHAKRLKHRWLILFVMMALSTMSAAEPHEDPGAALPFTVAEVFVTHEYEGIAINLGAYGEARLGSHQCVDRSTIEVRQFDGVEGPIVARTRTDT